MKLPLTLLLLLPVALAAAPPPEFLQAARKQLGVTVQYDPTYTVVSYPGGDVPIERGVCTDVVIRAMRGIGIDLQREVHEDMKRNFSAYPQMWGLRGPIEHRSPPRAEPDALLRTPGQEAAGER